MIKHDSSNRCLAIAAEGLVASGHALVLVPIGVESISQAKYLSIGNASIDSFQTLYLQLLVD